ncbi:VCBS repeat-containing protein, partial [bacterium]|nr:VCBS repeat-containing protein [bacterium]
NFGADITIQNIETLPSETLDSNGETIIVESIRASIMIASSANIGTRPVRIGSSAISFPAVFTVIHEDQAPPSGADTEFGVAQYATHSFNPEGVIAADFTHDGRLDLAVGTDGDDYTLLFRTISGGKLGAVKKLREPKFASALVASNDFNRDGNPDLAVGNRSASEVIIRYGTGGLNFSKPIRIPLPTPAWAIATGDFNGDSHSDLVAVTRDTNGIQLLLGNGNSTFQPARSFDAGDTPKSAAVADLNHDGLDDVIIANFAGSLSIYIGNRTSGLGSQRLKRVPTSIENLIAADLSGDGNSDVVTIGEDSIVILRGKGNGDFFSPKRIRIVDFLFDIAAGDFNGDSRIDLAFSNFVAGQLSVITNQGNLRFSPPLNLNTGSDPKRIVAADLNGDQKADLAVTNYLSHTISVYLNITAGK